jgi:predicted double-glycine peptidase
MGTFNYGDCQTENMKHYKYDVWPYFAWNNTKKAAALNRNGEKPKSVPKSVPIDKHPEAMMRYREYETLLGRDRKRD